MSTDNARNRQDVTIQAGDNATLEGVAIGDRNKIISQVQEVHGHVVQADHSQVHIGDIYYYFEIPKRDVIEKEPYKFLSTYSLEDADIFFGRTQAIDELSAHILDHKLVIINGKSGSGKSSLIHAGITPKLIRNNRLVIHITDYRETPINMIQDAIQGGLESPLVIFLDQFERFFIYLPPQEQHRFTIALRDWLADDTTTVRFVLAIRMDFFGRLGEFQPFIPNLYQQSAIFTLLPLNRDEAREAIEGPLEALKIRILYEQSLIETLLDSLLEDAEIEPAQLQIVCDELYHRAQASSEKIINAALYETAGGVKGILANYLQRKLTEYTPADDAVKAILKQMIAPVEVRAGIRTFVDVAHISERVNAPEEEVERLITRLVDDRLIEKKSGEETYSVAHEYMAGQVQQWFDPRETAIRRARDILDHAVRYDVLMPYQEASQVKEYVPDLELHDTERALLRRSLRKHTLGVWLRRGIVTVIALFAVIAGGAGFYANLQRKEAYRRMMLSFAQTLSVQAVDQLKHNETPRAVLLAQQAYLIHQRNQGTMFAQIDNALQSVLEGFTPQFREFAHPDTVYSVAFSPDGKLLASACGDKIVRLWDVAQPAAEPRLLAGNDAAVTFVAFSPDGQFLASGSTGAWLWDMKHLDDAPYIINTIDWANRYFKDYGDLPEKVWMILPIKEDFLITSGAFSPNSESFAFGTDRYGMIKIGLYKSESRIEYRSMWPNPTSFDTQPVSSVAFSPNSKILNRHSDEGGVGIVAFGYKDLIEGRMIKTRSGIRLESIGCYSDDKCYYLNVLSGHKKAVLSVAFSPDGKTLASGSRDATVQLSDLTHLDASPRVLGRERGGLVVPSVDYSGYEPHAAVTSVAFSPDGTRLASGSEDSIVRLWDLAHPTAVPRLLIGHHGPVTSVAFSPDGRSLASGSTDNTMRVWNIQPAALSCEAVTRNLTWDEWQEFVSTDLLYEPTCPNLPVERSVFFLVQKLASAGDIVAAKTIVQHIQEIDPNRRLGDFWLMLCRTGIAWGHVAKVQDACEHAVDDFKAENNAESRRMRGVARALNHNITGAIDDFQAFVAKGDNGEQKAECQQWIAALQKGENPFTPKVLESWKSMINVEETHLPGY